MDKSVGRWALLSAFGIFIVLGTSFPGALLSMFISGILPGTNYTLPLGVVMTIYPSIALLALYWITRDPIYIGETNKPIKEPTVLKTSRAAKKKSTSKQSVLKRHPKTAI